MTYKNTVRLDIESRLRPGFVALDEPAAVGGRASWTGRSGHRWIAYMSLEFRTGPGGVALEVPEIVAQE